MFSIFFLSLPKQVIVHVDVQHAGVIVREGLDHARGLAAPSRALDDHIPNGRVERSPDLVVEVLEVPSVLEAITSITCWRQLGS